MARVKNLRMPLQRCKVLLMFYICRRKLIISFSGNSSRIVIIQKYSLGFSRRYLSSYPFRKVKDSNTFSYLSDENTHFSTSVIDALNILYPLTHACDTSWHC